MKDAAEEAPIRIVLADDDEDDRDVFSEAIQSANIRHVLHRVEDGSKLLNYLSNCNSDCPHLIFLDLNMPKKSGIECLAEIRADQKFKDTIVVIYSTSSAKKDIDDSLIAGANIYITKPNNMEKLRNLITDIMSIDWQHHTAALNRDNFVMSR